MASVIYGATSLTGGGTGALDAIDGTSLTDLDGAIVISAGQVYTYSLDADSGLTENSPYVITPDANGGNKRWILKENKIYKGAKLTNLLYPSLSGGWRDIHRAGWSPFFFHQNWGGAPIWGGMDGDVTTHFETGYFDQYGAASAVGYDSSVSYEAQGFKVSRDCYVQAIWVKIYKVGNPTDNASCFIYSDTGGVPNALITNGTATQIAMTLLSTSASGTWTRFVFPTPPSISANTQYHIVLCRSGAVNISNLYYWSRNDTDNRYPYGGRSYGSSVPVWTSQTTCGHLFAIEATSTYDLLTAGDFDGNITFFEGTPLDQSSALSQPMKNFFNSREFTFLIRGESFTKNKTIADFMYGFDHDRIVVRSNATTGYAQVDLYESDGTKSTVTGTTDISTSTNKDIAISARIVGDGSDYLYLYINGISEGTPLTSQTFTMSKEFIDFGTANLGGGLPLAPTWTVDTSMSALPSSSSVWTYSGTSTEAAHFVVDGGKLYQQIVGSTDTSYYYKAPSLNNTNGWTVTWKAMVPYSGNALTEWEAYVYVQDAIRDIIVGMHSTYIESGALTKNMKYLLFNMKDREHTFILTGKGTDVYLFIDGRLTLSGTGLNCMGGTASNQIDFGDNTANAASNAEVVWDYIKYYNTANTSPEFTGGNLNEFAFWDGNQSSILPFLYNSGNFISCKDFLGLKMNYINFVPRTLELKGLSSSPSISTTEAIMPEMECMIYGEDISATNIACMNNSGTNYCYHRVWIDGVAGAIGYTYGSNVTSSTVSLLRKMPFGLHRAEARCFAASGTMTAYGQSRWLTVREENRGIEKC